MPSRPVSAPTSLSVLPGPPVVESTSRDASMRPTHMALTNGFPEYAAEQMGAWVERFFRLWCRNQWKRERYAPSFHLDDENLDPKTWCRFPILSGGFERELEELRQHLQQRS